MVRALFSEGPYGGKELALVGTPPSYLMLLSLPGVAMDPVIVGADFDDDWPGQQRYQLDRIYTGDQIATAVYVHEP
jgi:hypothetical protein